MDDAAPPPVSPQRRRWPAALTAIGLPLALLAALPFALDTAPGRALVAHGLSNLTLASGLRFRIGRIDGSLWGRAALVEVAACDLDGCFARSPRLVLDWRPLALLDNRFEARELSTPRLSLARLPRLQPSPGGRLLPDQDIIVRRLAIGRLELAPGIAGPGRSLTASARLDLHAGRALVDLDARALSPASGDRLRVALDASPDEDRMALDARLSAPAGGVVDGLLKLGRSLEISADGKGRWRGWTGHAGARLGGDAQLASLALSGSGARLAASGRINPAPLLAGSAARLLAGGLTLALSSDQDGPMSRLALNLGGRALTARFDGRLDRGAERLLDSNAELRLTDAAAAEWGASGLVLGLKANGPLLAPQVDARLNAVRLRLPGKMQDGSALAIEGLKLASITDLAQRPLSLPLRAEARALTGLPEALAPLAGPWTGEGVMAQAGNGEWRGNDLALAAGPARFRLGLSIAPARRAWGLKLVGTAKAWALPALGPTDLALDAVLKPGPGGGIAGTGRFTASARQAEQAALARLAAGPLQLAGDLALEPGAGLNVAAANLAVKSAGLTASGRAGWRGGAFTLAASGETRAFGAFRLAGEGTLAAPQFSASLPRPGYGLADVEARLDGRGANWRLVASAGSPVGTVALAADVRTGAQLALDVEQLAVAGLTGKGTLTQDAQGPFAGTLAIDGAGLDGRARLWAAGGVQQAELALAGKAATLPLTIPVSVDSLALTARLSLPDSGPGLTANLDIIGLERGSLVLEKANAAVTLVDGGGTAALAIAGNSGAPFHINLAGEIAPERLRLTGDGDYEGRKASLAQPALITRDAAGWHLATTRLVSGLGNAELAGDWGRQRRLQARLDQVSMGLVTLAFPSIALSGRVSGALDLALDAADTLSGTANLRLNGLSRANIAATSSPIDVGLNAAMGAGGTVARAVIVRAGQIEGRAQARIGPLPAGETLATRLAAASVAGQLRYAGPAQDLWGLGGLTALDVRGNAQISADVAGTLGEPQVAGLIRVAGGRVEAPVLGAVATGASLEARFNASRLDIQRFAGSSGQGSITGAGSIDLSFDRGFPMDIRMVVKDAAILGRDDLTAVGSGNIRLATDEYGGVVSGTLTLSRAEYRVGRTAVADVPVLAVTERNTRVLGRRTVQYVAPTRWLYNLTIDAERRLMVTGMGVTSEWQANVRLRGGATAPELFGRVQLVRGDYDFSGKRFQLTRGDIRFQGGYPPDPIINVTAENASNGFTALLSIEGTAQRPQIKFSSVPALPEDEVLSRVLFGSRVTDLSAPEAIQLAGALTSLRGGGFNPIGAVGRGLGIDRLRILPADVTTGRKTTFAAGQYVGRNVYVELATDAQGYSATSIEIGLTRSLSLLSSVATLGGTAGAVRWKKDY